MKSTLAIAGREFRSYFYSPLAYVVICLSMILLGIFFFFIRGGFWQVDRASFDRMFQLGALGLCLIIIPALTMRLIAEEKHSGTLEMLISLPVKDSEVIMGKFLGALGLVLVLLLASAMYPLMMFVWPWNLGPLDPGPVLSGYLGLLLLSMAAIAVGLMISSLTSSISVAWIVTFITLLLLYNAAAIGEFVPGMVGDFFRFMSFDTNVQNFARGMIDTRNIIYFLSITGLCLFVAFRSLESRKWS